LGVNQQISGIFLREKYSQGKLATHEKAVLDCPGFQLILSEEAFSANIKRS